MTLLGRYNAYYNDECAALPHGGPVSMEEMQAMTLECMVEAFKSRYNLDSIPADKILGLAEQLRAQGTKW